VAAALGLEPEVVPDLREVDFGIAEGRTLAELRESHPDAAAAVVADPGAHPFPGAEPPAAAAGRAVAALRGVADRHRGSSVLVVAHNTLLRLALCAWLGIPLARYRDVLPRLENAAATRLRVPADPARPPALLSLNVPTSPSNPAVTADAPAPSAGRTP
jgi:probable phosphoglycerate mutase